MSSDFHFLVPESFKQNLVQIGTEVSEKIQFDFLYLHTLGQGQEITRPSILTYLLYTGIQLDVIFFP